MTEAIELLKTDGRLEAPGFESSSTPIVPQPSSRDVRWGLWLDKSSGKIFASIKDQFRGMGMDAYANSEIEWQFVFEMDYLGE